MPLSWNEIRDRALRFSKDWEDVEREKAEAQTFWNEFFEVFGKRRRTIALYEKKVENLPKGARGFIDLFWPGQLIVEHKSRGKDLDSAFLQAADYILALEDHERPRYVIVSDFHFIRLYDLEGGAIENYQEFPLEKFHEQVRLFGFIAGYTGRRYEGEDPVNIKAAELVGKLHDALKESGYDEQHSLQLMLVRLVFCFFADDTGIFEEKDIFRLYIEDRTAEDGSDFGAHLSTIFQVLNTPEDRRQSNLDEQLQDFPYIDGELFEELIPTAAFNSKMRQAILDCARFDWAGISPAIFGAMFQSVMDPDVRHDLGAHYTSEKNILKVIGGLFLDDLKDDLENIGMNQAKLRQFHQKIADMRVMDPACGCGNFLVVTYRELRLLEIEIIKRLFPERKSHIARPQLETLVKIDVDSVYGIEIEEFPVRIAELAMWLTDHQMNMRLSEEIGEYYRRLPLTRKANIVQGNALRIDWNDIIEKNELDFIFGNPPFLGSKLMSKEQRQEIGELFPDAKRAGVLDYVTGWYAKAAEYIQGTDIRVAFVSTNSITQGEQVGTLWSALFKRFDILIHFAHRTFKWSNEARGKAAVYCVIIGFGTEDVKGKTIYEYDDVKGDPMAIRAKHINPYLVDAPDVLIMSRSKPISNVPEIGIGNKPIDGGNYLFTPEEKEEFLKKEPQAEPYFKKWLGAREFIQGSERWCLWLGDCPPEKLRQMPEAMKRVEAVREFRLASKSEPTRRLAETPTRFHVENIPKADYLIIPKVSSEARRYIPIGFMPPDTLASDLVFIFPNAKPYHFGVLTSEMHMAWVRQVCGRLKGDYRYSKDIVYNNFPWPGDPTKVQIEKIEEAADSVLEARKKFPDATMADLYDPIAMPKDLRDAHAKLDRAVDLAYGKTKFKTETERLNYLFGLYQSYLSKAAE